MHNCKPWVCAACPVQGPGGSRSPPSQEPASGPGRGSPPSPPRPPPAAGSPVALCDSWPHQRTQLQLGGSLLGEGMREGQGYPLAVRSIITCFRSHWTPPESSKLGAGPWAREQKFPLDVWGAGSFPLAGGGRDSPLRKEKEAGRVAARPSAMKRKHCGGKVNVHRSEYPRGSGSRFQGAGQPASEVGGRPSFPPLLSVQGSLVLRSQTAWNRLPIALSSSQAGRPMGWGLQWQKVQMPDRAAQGEPSAQGWHQRGCSGPWEECKEGQARRLGHRI